MLKSRFLFIIILIVSFNSHSQDLSLNVISNQGGSGVIEGIKLNWTIGEPIVETVENSAIILNQGFHQSVFNSTSLSINQENNLGLVIWPNPVNNELNISLDTNLNSKLNLNLYEVSGRFINQASVNTIESNISIDVTNLSSGIYVLHISDSNGFIKTHKIIKQ